MSVHTQTAIGVIGILLTLTLFAYVIFEGIHDATARADRIIWCKMRQEKLTMDQYLNCLKKGDE